MARNFVAASSQALFNNTGASLSGLAEPFTVACWSRLASTTVADRGLMSLANAAANQRHLLYWWNDAPNQRIAMFSSSGVGGDQANSAVISNDTNYHHIAGVVAATNSRTTYFDGTAGTTNTSNITGITGLAQYVIGGYYPNGSFVAGFYMDGDIAECTIWNVALTQAEITALSKRAHPWLVRPAALVSHYMLDGWRNSEPDMFAADYLGSTGSPGQAAHPPLFRKRRPLIYPGMTAAVAPTAVAPLRVATTGMIWR